MPSQSTTGLRGRETNFSQTVHIISGEAGRSGAILLWRDLSHQHEGPAQGRDLLYAGETGAQGTYVIPCSHYVHLVHGIHGQIKAAYAAALWPLE